MWIVLIVLLLLALFLILSKPGSLRPPKIGGRGRVEFYSKGMDAGFSLQEINLLWAASQRAELANPPAMKSMWSRLVGWFAMKSIKLSIFN